MPGERRRVNSEPGTGPGPVGRQRVRAFGGRPTHGPQRVHADSRVHAALDTPTATKAPFARGADEIGHGPARGSSARIVTDAAVPSVWTGRLGWSRTTSWFIKCKAK